jgi:LCP family protein required for cell wall assembly
MIIEPPRARRRWPVVLAVVLVVTLAAAAAGAWWFDRSLDRVPVEGLADREDDDGDGDEDPDVGDDELDRSLHVLVAGSDDRSVLTSSERRELSTGSADGERTEALMLLRLDPELDRVDALRFPRDLLVTRCDGSRGRINAAYAIGERDRRDGPSCLVRTITDFTALPIHHVVKVDFRGFVDLVDAVGGVEVWLDEPLRDRNAGIDLDEGCVELRGPDALGFVRARQMDDDLQRIDRQQQLVAAIMDQVVTASTLTDPRRLGMLITTAQRSLELDESLSAGELRRIAQAVGDLGADDLESRTVAGTPHVTDEGTAFLEPDEAYASRLFRAFARGDLPSVPADPDEVPDPGEDPSDTRTQGTDGRDDPDDGAATDDDATTGDASDDDGPRAEPAEERC